MREEKNMPLKPSGSSSRSVMASLGSLSFLFSNSKPHSFLPSNPNANSRLRLSRTHILNFSANSDQKNGLSDSPVSEKKSFAVATGELFLGLASRFIRRSNSNGDGDSVSVPVTMFRDAENSKQEAYLSGRRGRIATVVEDTIEPAIIWEQRVKDVKAERDRRQITSPGFSFSAAGLLFPYHLGVAQFLIEKGYIKVGCFIWKFYICAL
uniref:Uncharacterized protein n=1 Tax=Nelumbo nucifera TaxID=4432 RepID=A0A822XSC8_NELNU|nr:TPA_asm: hypothetical protein HUJ06_025968 [Nelumbo nucifera]